MAIVRIFQPPIEKERYDAVSSKVDVASDPPDGLILHCAGEVNGGWQIIEVWESEEQATRFDEERLAPVIREFEGAAPDGGGNVNTTSYELHNLVTP